MLICRCEFTRYSVYGILTRFQIYYVWQEAHGRCTPPYSCRIPATRGRGIPAESSHERFHRHRDNLRLLAPQYLPIASSPRSANIYSRFGCASSGSTVVFQGLFIRSSNCTAIPNTGDCEKCRTLYFRHSCWPYKTNIPDSRYQCLRALLVSEQVFL